MQGEELFDTFTRRERSVNTIVKEILTLAHSSSIKLHRTNADMGVDGDHPKSLMLSYRVTTGTPADTKDDESRDNLSLATANFSTS